MQRHPRRRATTASPSSRAACPRTCYYDPRHYERELKRIWYRNWIYVGRSSDVAASRGRSAPSRSATRSCCWCATTAACCRVFTTPAATAARRCAAKARGFCARGRSSVPIMPGCTTCRATCCAPPRRDTPTASTLRDFPLYKIKVHEWRGFIFVALADRPAAVRAAVRPAPGSARRLAARRTRGRPRAREDHTHATGKYSGRTTTSACIVRACIRSCRSLVPIYGRGLLEERDDPNWTAHAARPRPEIQGRAARGAGDAGRWTARLTGRPFPQSVG